PLPATFPSFPTRRSSDLGCFGRLLGELDRATWMPRGPSRPSATPVSRRLRIGIDTGGTFTDIVAIDEATGEIVTTKTPSTPHDPDRKSTRLNSSHGSI